MFHGHITRKITAAHEASLRRNIDDGSAGWIRGVSTESVNQHNWCPPRTFSGCIQANNWVLLQHGVDLCLCTEKHTSQVDLIYELEVINGKDRRVPKTNDARDISTVINPPKRAHSLVDHSHHRVLIPNINGDCFDACPRTFFFNLSLDSLQELDVNVGYDYPLTPFSGVKQRRCFSNS